MQPLDDAELRKAMKNLPFWDAHEELSSEFRFEDFKQAMEFVNQLAELAEQRQHHPEITIDYDTVYVSLSTKDANDKITDKDVAMAHAIEDMVDSSDILSRFE